MEESSKMNEPQDLTKKERYNLQREEKQRLEEVKCKNQKIKRVVKWAVFVIIAAGGVYGLAQLFLGEVPKQMGELFAEQGRAHISEGTAHPAYNSNPPTSGWHYAEEANWGVYQNELPDEKILHNLEHGGIWISYNNVATDTIEKIENLAKRYPDKLIVEPRSKNTAKIVLASWTRLLKLNQFDEVVITGFIRANKNRSPEPNAN